MLPLSRENFFFHLNSTFFAGLVKHWMVGEPFNVRAVLSGLQRYGAGGLRNERETLERILHGLETA